MPGVSPPAFFRLIIIAKSFAEIAHLILQQFLNGGTKKGVLKTLIPAALENGGNKLDNFNSPKLSAMYELYGFDPVSGTEFNEQFAPDDWNYERDSKPDIIFWIHNGEDAKDVVLNFGNYIVDWRNVTMFGTYEEARQYRDELLNDLYK